MVFSSLIFLFGFFPVFFLFYYIAPHRFKNIVLLMGSLFFYSWSAPRFIFVLLFGCIVDYWIGRRITQVVKIEQKKLLLFLSITLNLGLLAYCKYVNFFIGEVNRFLFWTNGTNISWTAVILPIGISFITFHKISYIVDIYRGTAKSARSFLEFIIYILAFPQLIAGPIIRYHDVENQLKDRSLTIYDVGDGWRRFALGLGKKVLIANSLGEVAGNIFALNTQTLTPFLAWLGILSYTFQLFFDFSGYSDMAIGLGRMMGFKWMENFNHPYIATNITDFWRRWHISLSRFMREYVYIPLGGSRVASWRMYLNLLIVFTLSGIWHGANWTFLIWGLYHGLFIVLDKAGLARLTERLPKFISTTATFFVVVIGWVFFKSDTIGIAWQYLGHMFGVVSYMPVPGSIFLEDVIGARGWLAFCLAVLLSFLPMSKYWLGLSTRTFEEKNKLSIVAFNYITTFLIASISVMYIVNTGFNPFIYFRF